jgi:putative membrane protein
MIKSYSDYAANERTFLAWVRTAIALMAFGFLIERFDLFLQMAAVTLGDKAPRITGADFGRSAGLGLLLAGVAITVVAAIRFVKMNRDIASPDLKSHRGSRIDIALAVLLALLGLALVIYLSHAIVTSS